MLLKYYLKALSRVNDPSCQNICFGIASIYKGWDNDILCFRRSMNEFFLVVRPAEVCITAIDSTGKFGVIYKEFQKTFFMFLEK